MRAFHRALLRDSRCIEREYILNNLKAKMWIVEIHVLLKATGRRKNSGLAMPKLLQSILSSVEVPPVRIQ